MVNKVAAFIRVLGAAACLAVAGVVVAQVAPAPAPAAPAKPVAQSALAKPLWASLTAAQKTALEPLNAEWDHMDGTRKQKWLDIANRFGAMKPDEQARVHEKMREWVKMTPDERRLVRENYTKAKKLDVTQKSEQWEKYQQLPEEQKQKLAADAAIAAKKKQLTNLPPPNQANVKPIAPIKRNPAEVACPTGMVRNPKLATPTPPASTAIPACVAATAPVAPGTSAPPAATSAIPAAAATAPVNAK